MIFVLTTEKIFWNKRKIKRNFEYVEIELIIEKG